MTVEKKDGRLHVMARIIKNPRFKAMGRGNGCPWDLWLDGRARLLVEGKDFAGKATYFRNRAYTIAKTRGRRIRVQMEDGGVLLQARA